MKFTGISKVLMLKCDPTAVERITDMITSAFVFAGMLFFFIITPALAASDLPDLTSPNGLKFKLIDGFRDWRVISGHARIDKGEIRFIWGNAAVVKSYNASRSSGAVKFEKGSILVKSGHTLAGNIDFGDSIEPYRLQRIEYMVKDEIFKDTGGWGYARFVYDRAAKSFKPYGKDAKFAGECYACHLKVSRNDFVFTGDLFGREIPGAEPVQISLGSGSSMRSLPLWLVHAMCMSCGVMFMLAGIYIARIKKSNTWMKTHKISELVCLVFLLSGLTAAVYMTGAGAHFRIPHAVFGIITFVCAALNIVIGLSMPRFQRFAAGLRSIHRWNGQITTVMAILTIIGGIIHASAM
jgi:hypothetical protein